MLPRIETELPQEVEVLLAEMGTGFSEELDFIIGTGEKEQLYPISMAREGQQLTYS
jgi:hypothetical protein